MILVIGGGFGGALGLAHAMGDFVQKHVWIFAAPVVDFVLPDSEPIACAPPSPPATRTLGRTMHRTVKAGVRT